MKSLILLFLFGMAWAMPMRKDPVPALEMDVTSSPTIVELFTSQGCSSCPAADRLLNDVIQQSKNGEVIGLSFHVSYWNYLGWKDPYSSEAFTERQKTYSSVLNLQSIYTPQMIVNGRTEFVGSDNKALVTALKASKSSSSGFNITASEIVSDKNISVRYKLNALPPNAVLNIAFIESMVENFVPRGENKGLTLKHFNVVRSFRTAKAETEGVFEVAIPDNVVSIKATSIVLYLQDRSTLKILGAVGVKPG